MVGTAVPTVVVGTVVPTVIVGTGVPTRVVGTAANTFFVPTIIVGTIVPTMIVVTAVPTIIVLLAYYWKSYILHFVGGVGVEGVPPSLLILHFLFFLFCILTCNSMYSYNAHVCILTMLMSVCHSACGFVCSQIFSFFQAKMTSLSSQEAQRVRWIQDCFIQGIRDKRER